MYAPSPSTAITVRSGAASFTPRSAGSLLSTGPAARTSLGDVVAGGAIAAVLVRYPSPGMRVLDLGAGGGLVAIAAMKAGAGQATAVDIDPDAIEMVALNAEANSVAVVALCGDPLDGAPPAVDLVLVGDLFYEARLAARLVAFLDRCAAAGIPSLIGDPGRAPLPRARLARLAPGRRGIVESTAAKRCALQPS